MADTYLNRLLGESESILLVTHQHWLVWFGEILVESLLTIAIIVLITLLGALLPNPFVWLGYLLLILPFGSILRDYLIWDNRKFVVTSRRVIRMSGVFNKDITDSSLEKVNVFSSVTQRSGLIPAFSEFGGGRRDARRRTLADRNRNGLV